jgi:hypothetical protein
MDCESWKNIHRGQKIPVDEHFELDGRGPQFRTEDRWRRSSDVNWRDVWSSGGEEMTKTDNSGQGVAWRIRIREMTEVRWGDPRWEASRGSISRVLRGEVSK